MTAKFSCYCFSCVAYVSGLFFFFGSIISWRELFQGRRKKCCFGLLLSAMRNSFNSKETIVIFVLAMIFLIIAAVIKIAVQPDVF